MRRPVWGTVASSQPGSSASEHVTLLPDPGPGGKLNTDLEGRDGMLPVSAYGTRIHKFERRRRDGGTRHPA